jgi:hypothetical protein
MMTKQHFESIAAVLKSRRPADDDHDTHRCTAWRDMVIAFAAMCVKENPRFDASRFYDACGYSAKYFGMGR